jgi:8-oxo-dGTP diphosphatase
VKRSWEDAAIMQRTRVAAYGLITDGERILLCRISPELPRIAGLWTLPGGGIDFGELPVSGMIREVAEETGLVVEPIGLAYVDSNVFEGENIVQHNVRVFYHAKIIGGELRDEPQGTTDRCEWWSRHELPPMVELAEIGIRIAFTC